MVTSPITPFRVRPARIEEIVSLRHTVLRAGLPREAAYFEGDELPTTRHWAAVGVPPPGAGAGSSSSDIIGCLTLVLSTLDNETAWQLRGMAVAPEWRTRGVGRELVNEVYRVLRQENAPLLLWCNAREVALEFYRKLGWTVFSDRFEIPTAGPHYKMRTRVIPPPPL